MRFYYQPIDDSPGRRRFSLAVSDEEYARDAPKFVSQGGTVADGSGFIYVKSDVPGNQAVIAGVLRWLGRQAGQPLPPRYRAAPPSQIELPDETLFTPQTGPVTNPDRQALFDPLPGGMGLVARLDQIRTNVIGLNLLQTQTAVRDLTIILYRLLRRLRQREGESPDD